MGGQKTLRTYWKNYFEKTDTLIWVVDATDRERIDDCRQELKGLLVQEVKSPARSGSSWPSFSVNILLASHGSLSAGPEEQE